MSAESLFVAYAYAHAYCYRGAKVYSYTEAASDAAASALRPAFSGRSFGDSR